jgi:hypothetical protein
LPDDRCHCLVWTETCAVGTDDDPETLTKALGPRFGRLISTTEQQEVQL